MTKSWSTKARYAQIPGQLQPAQWGQVLPKGSLRKARSNLMTTAARVRNPSIHLERCLSDSHPSRPHGSNRGDTFATSVSETSTEEDPEFGFDIHRTSCNLGLSHITTQDSSNLSTLKSYPSTIRLHAPIPARDGGQRSKWIYLSPKKPCQNENRIANGHVCQTAETTHESKCAADHTMTSTRLNVADPVRDIRPAENLLRVNRVQIGDSTLDSSACSTEGGIRASSGDGYLTLSGNSSSKLLDMTTTELARIPREISVTDESQCSTPKPDSFHNHPADRTAMLTVASASNPSASRSNMRKLPPYEATSALSIAAPKDFC
jgi:hypothetical protein